MKFALVNNIKVEATKGVRGICPNCGSELIAKCGKVKVNHWSHKSIKNCDRWWESETEWHRSWKNNFPKDWQEISMLDQKTGEKHIADVNTDNNLVIEFQHSFINEEERVSREAFYGNMIWVVDGTRLKRDYPRFLKGINNLRKINRQNWYLVDFPEECFPSTWLNSTVPVIFDFKGIQSIEEQTDLRNNLYCIRPKEKAGETVLVVFPYELFIRNTISGAWFNKQKEEIKHPIKKPTQNLKLKRNRTQAYFYDPKRKRYVRKRRL